MCQNPHLGGRELTFETSLDLYPEPRRALGVSLLVWLARSNHQVRGTAVFGPLAQPGQVSGRERFRAPRHGAA